MGRNITIEGRANAKSTNREKSMNQKDQTIVNQLDAFHNRACVLPFDDPGYEPPTPGEVDALIKLAGWSQNQAAKIVGVTYNPKKGSTTIRKWRTRVESSEHRTIPYSAWRLMLITARLADAVLPTSTPSERLRSAQRDLNIIEDYLLDTPLPAVARRHGVSENHVNNRIRYFYGIANGCNGRELGQTERQYKEPFHLGEGLNREFDGATDKITYWRPGLVDALKKHYNSTYNWQDPKVRPK